MAVPRPSRHRSAVPVRDGDLFTRADALDAGWTDAALGCAVDAGRLHRVRQGVYAPGPVRPPLSPAHVRSDLLRRGLAAAAGSSGTVLGHAAAAVAYGLPAVCSLERPCLTVQRGTGMRNLVDAHLHRALLPPGDVRRTAPPRSRHRPGLAGPLAESALESISRLRIAEHGLPAPVLQARLGDPHGRFIRRVDMYWPEFGVAGEADGNEKYDNDRGANRAEKWQQEQLEELGLVVVRWGWADRNRFEPVARRLERAFARGTPAGRGQRWSVLRVHLDSA